MSKLYSENMGVIEVSNLDSEKVGRGMPVGYEYGIVTDLRTGNRFHVYSESCGSDSCNCAVTFQPVEVAKV